jgi:hypothetical protein
MKKIKNFVEKTWNNRKTKELEQASQPIEADSLLKNNELMDIHYPSSENTLLQDKLKLHELARLLEVKSLRTAISWCKKHGVAIYNKGKVKFVYIIDFNLAVDSPFIESLKIKFPQNWSEIYATYKRLDYEKLVELLIPQNTLSRRKFSVEGNVANNFLDKMKNSF